MSTLGHRNEMCSLKVAIFTDVLLQVKAFVLYPHRYDHEALSGKVQTFFKALAKRSLKLFKFAFISTLMPYARVKYVAHRASCFAKSYFSYHRENS